MSNQNGGPLQVYDNSVASINLALAQILERLDNQNGLRGAATVHDRLGVNAPQDTGDAVNLGTLNDAESVSHITILAMSGTGIIRQPGTTYVELAATLRLMANFASPQSIEGRVIVQGWGTEAGEKGVAITESDGTIIAEVEWTGTDEETVTGTFTAIDLEADTEIQVRVKGASATEYLILRGIVLDLRYDIDVTATV